MKNSALNKLYFTLIIFYIPLFLIFSGCSVTGFNNYKKTGKLNPTQASALKPIISKDTLSHIYKAGIFIYNKYYSGLIVYRYMPSGNSRVIFMSEMGIKFFDFEFIRKSEQSKAGFKIHYCMDAINRKAIINILRNDFGLLTMNDYRKITEMKQRKTSNYVLKLRARGNSLYYIYNKESKLINIKQTRFIFNKVNADIFQSTDNITDSIKISHYNIKLKINLNLINN